MTATIETKQQRIRETGLKLRNLQEVSDEDRVEFYEFVDGFDKQGFELAFEIYFARLKKIREEYRVRRGYSEGVMGRLEVQRGRRYIKIIIVGDSQRSVHSFVDLKGGKLGKSVTKRGDILKSANWRTPAPHARGSIFNAGEWRKCVGTYGAAYLR